MQANPSLTVRTVDRAVDPWLLITGGSFGLVAGIAADLLRMGLHNARRARAAWAAGPLAGGRDCHCPGGCS